MIDGPTPHLFYLPVGVDFAENLVAGLRMRMHGKAPESLARVKVYVNSQRMRRRVTDVMTETGASFLPHISVISDLGDDLTLSDLPPPVPELRRKLELALLVKGLLKAQPELAPMTARFDLADSLADLLAEMQDEAVTPDAISALDVSGHSEHWARTQAFLNIVAPLFQDFSDPRSRQREAAVRLAKCWSIAPPTDPVIIAGSTGSRGTTALLMQAVAALPNGAVVVPGFDADLPAKVWQGMTNALTDEDHPQFRFRRLMDALGATHVDFQPWFSGQPHDAERNTLVSLALRPAPVTDQWLVEGQTLGDLRHSTEDLTLIEAANPREEAQAIALVLRRSLDEGKRAALISPDRDLTRRVAAALTRWGIMADDSAGRPLALSATGRLLRHVARAFRSQLTADQLLTLLKHPLAGSGPLRGEHLTFTRALELHLRRHGPAFPDGETLLQWAQMPRYNAAQNWAEHLAKVISLLQPAGVSPLAVHVARHIGAAEALARGQSADGSGNLWLEPAGIEARKLLDSLVEHAQFGDEMSCAEYQMFFDNLIATGEVREVYSRHPLIAFYGHREAREMHADVVVMGGLTDGIWPASADPDPWLNRKMRREAGLLLPERQIGLAAHDFQQAIAAKAVVLSRSTRDAEAETVPSRWLNRLCNLMEGLPAQNGPEALLGMRARGQVWINSAKAIDKPSEADRSDPRLAPAKRPSPRPPVQMRPDRLPLSRISALIRDPYAIYARYILNLKPLDHLRHAPENRDRGTVMHKILESFVKEKPAGESFADAYSRLMDTASQLLEQETPFPSARVLWLARLQRAAHHLLRQDAKHQGAPILVEEKGTLAVGSTGFVLFGTPDRIDRLPDGKLHLIDYKTGSPPTKLQQETFDKQLLLGAAMAERGGFAGLGRADVARITYIGLGSGDKAIDTEVTAEMLAEQWNRFTVLIDAYSQRKTGYTARRAIFETRQPLDYDHLSRFGEWQMSDRAVPELVGHTDA